MLRNTLSVISLCVLFAGCASHNAQSVAYDPVNDARIRVYFGVTTKFFFNSTCETKARPLRFGYSGTWVSKPRLLNLANTTIGMPVPEDAYRYYDEYVIKANQPLTISVHRLTGIHANIPEHDAGTFIPQAGRDYEVFASKATGFFRLNVRKLSVVDEHVNAEVVDVKGVRECQGASTPQSD
ncbi:hypothetical protein [Burkholderia sp. BCC1977]|uniref:hypothetical protein n=1 Tax=Burkholderia sp. BCC1977 TaxID=2817440 RepID=UPI002ABD5208|nr:hypothetical protein [Burkholderia sp. BCC1977]